MKVSLEKKYRTRDGYKVVIYTVTSVNELYPVVGHIISSIGQPVLASWTAEGFYSRHGPASTSYQRTGGMMDLIIDENG